MIEPLQMLALLRKRSFWIQTSPFLGEELFQGDLGVVYKALGRYWKSFRGEGNAVASIKSIEILCSKHGGKSQEIIKHILKDIGGMEVDPPKEVVRATEDFITRQALGTMALEVAQAVDRTEKLDVGVFRRKLDKLSKLQGSLEDPGVDYTKYTTDYFKTLDKGRIPTGLTEIDQHIGGGLGAGELGVLVGAFRGGKTTYLVNFGASALEHGKHVFHLTLEIHTSMVAMRYDMRIGGFTTEELRKNRKNIQTARNKLKAKKGSLTILDRSHEKLSVHTLEKILERALTDKPVDLVLIDYADLLRPDYKVLQGQSRFALSDIYQELRRISSKLRVPVWTASQANREASRSGNFDSTFIAEDISKVQTADVVICLNQPAAYRASSQMVLKVDKTRMSSFIGDAATVQVDYDRMRILPLEQGEQVSQKAKRKVKEVQGGEEEGQEENHQPRRLRATKGRS